MGCRGFTLIELLVVIAIIAILSSILSPAVMTALDRGKSLKCVGILKEFGTAHHMYATDNDVFTPLKSGAGGAGGNIESWCGNNTFRKILGMDPDGNDYIFPAAFICPKAVLSWADPRFDGYIIWYSYGYSTEGMLSEFGSWADDSDWAYKPEQITRPSSTIMMGDATDWNMDSAASAEYLTAGEAKPPSHMIAYRHDDNVNLLMYDGHVEGMHYTVVVTNDNLWEAIR